MALKPFIFMQSEMKLNADSAKKDICEKQIKKNTLSVFILDMVDYFKVVCTSRTYNFFLDTKLKYN